MHHSKHFILRESVRQQAQQPHLVANNLPPLKMPQVHTPPFRRGEPILRTNGIENSSRKLVRSQNRKWVRHKTTRLRTGTTHGWTTTPRNSAQLVDVTEVRASPHFFHRNEPRSLHDVASRSGLVNIAFVYLSDMSQIVGILCNNGHVRIYTRTAKNTTLHHPPMHSDLTKTLTQNTTKHLNSVHIWISIATVCILFCVSVDALC